LLLRDCTCGGFGVGPNTTGFPGEEATLTPEPGKDKPTPTPVLPIDGTGEANEGEEYDPDKIREQLNAEQKYCTIKACNYMELKAPTYEGVLKYKNDNDFYVQISILPYDNDIADLSQAYFTSVVLAPGEEMNKVTLTKNLKNLRPGQQPCLLSCFCYEKNENGNYTYLGTGGLKITINMLSQ